MSDIKKHIQLVEAQMAEAIPGYTTTANLDAFVRDVAKAFGGQQGKTLNITVTLVASGVLEYSIQSA